MRELTAAERYERARRRCGELGAEIRAREWRLMSPEERRLRTTITNLEASLAGVARREQRLASRTRRDDTT